jgi:hypothetical protein
MNEPFGNAVLSVTAAPPGFCVDVWHYETPRGGQQTLGEKRRFPVVAWATVKLDDWSTGREDTRVEPVFLCKGVPTHTSEYRRLWSDLTPAAGEPKRTVGVYVVEPPGYVALAVA